MYILLTIEHNDVISPGNCISRRSSIGLCNITPTVLLTQYNHTVVLTVK